MYWKISTGPYSLGCKQRINATSKDEILHLDFHEDGQNEISDLDFHEDSQNEILDLDFHEDAQNENNETLEILNYNMGKNFAILETSISHFGDFLC